MTSTGSKAEVVAHQVWGEPEVLSCYSSSSQDDSSYRRGVPSRIKKSSPGPRARDESASGSQSEQSAEPERQQDVHPRKKKVMPADVAEHITINVRKESDSGQSQDSVEAEGYRQHAGPFVNQDSSSSQQAPLRRNRKIQNKKKYPTKLTVRNENESSSQSELSAETDTSRPEQSQVDSSCEESANAGQPTFQPNLVSRGSSLHDSGTCRPCMYVNASGGCWHAADCKFCHLPHPKPVRRRPSKRTRTRCRQVMAFLELGPASPEQMITLQSQLVSQDPYMETLLRGRQKSLQAQAVQARAANRSRPPARSEEDVQDTGASSSHQGGNQAQASQAPESENEAAV